MNVLVTNSSELRSLNRRFRGEDQGHGRIVVSSAGRRSAAQAKRVAGDVAISADIARENAERLGHSVADEMKILVLHGILHLAGFDHERDNGEMARKESRLRRQLKLEAGSDRESATAQRRSLHFKGRTDRHPAQAENAHELVASHSR